MRLICNVFEIHNVIHKIHNVKIIFQRSGGVKMEFIRNSFDSIQKFAIRLIQKGKKY